MKSKKNTKKVLYPKLAKYIEGLNKKAYEDATNNKDKREFHEGEIKAYQTLLKKLGAYKEPKKMEEGGPIQEPKDDNIPAPDDTTVPPVNAPIQEPPVASVTQNPISAPVVEPQTMSIGNDAKIIQAHSQYPKGEIPVIKVVEILGRKPKHKELINSIIIEKCFMRPFYKIKQ